jgi:hypothetical protein
MLYHSEACDEDVLSERCSMAWDSDEYTTYSVLCLDGFVPLDFFTMSLISLELDSIWHNICHTSSLPISPLALLSFQKLGFDLGSYRHCSIMGTHKHD